MTEIELIEKLIAEQERSFETNRKYAIDSAQKVIGVMKEMIALLEEGRTTSISYGDHTSTFRFMGRAKENKDTIRSLKVCRLDALREAGAVPAATSNATKKEGDK